jgi:DNA polymerase III epsilon subunit-like protein
VIILDLETTGFSPRKDDILEVSALKISGLKIIEEFHSFFKPFKAIPSIISSKTNIYYEDVKEAPIFSDKSRLLFNFMKGHRIIGYNVSFDKSFLVAKDSIFSCLEYQDYLKYIKTLEYDLPNYKMKTVANYFGVNTKEAHRAKGDTLILFELIKRLGI